MNAFEEILLAALSTGPSALQIFATPASTATPVSTATSAITVSDEFLAAFLELRAINAAKQVVAPAPVAIAEP